MREGRPPARDRRQNGHGRAPPLPPLRRSETALEHQRRFSARRGPYRVIYELVEDQRLVRVIAIGHRRDVYRRR